MHKYSSRHEAGSDASFGLDGRDEGVLGFEPIDPRRRAAHEPQPLYLHGSHAKGKVKVLDCTLPAARHSARRRRDLWGAQQLAFQRLEEQPHMFQRNAEKAGQHLASRVLEQAHAARRDALGRWRQSLAHALGPGSESAGRAPPLLAPRLAQPDALFELGGCSLVHTDALKTPVLPAYSQLHVEDVDKDYPMRYVPGFDVLLWDLVREEDAGLVAKVDAPLGMRGPGVAEVRGIRAGPGAATPLVAKIGDASRPAFWRSATIHCFANPARLGPRRESLGRAHTDGGKLGRAVRAGEMAAQQGRRRAKAECRVKVASE